jgi:hypothetical protein
MRVEAIGSITSIMPLYPVKPVSRNERLARIADKEKRVQEEKDSRSRIFFKPEWLGRYFDTYA